MFNMNVFNLALEVKVYLSIFVLVYKKKKKAGGRLSRPFHRLGALGIWA